MVGGTDSSGQELLCSLNVKNTPFISLGALSGLSLDVLQEPILSFYVLSSPTFPHPVLSDLLPPTVGSCEKVHKLHGQRCPKELKSDVTLPMKIFGLYPKLRPCAIYTRLGSRTMFRLSLGR